MSEQPVNKNNPHERTVIACCEHRGEGTNANPDRTVLRIYSLSGELLAERDPERDPEPVAKLRQEAMSLGPALGRVSQLLDECGKKSEALDIDRAGSDLVELARKVTGYANE